MFDYDKTAFHPAPVTQINPSKADDASLHDEHLLDDALDQTFPASDPFVERSSPYQPSEQEIQNETLLDNALELTFPASDPIAISSCYQNAGTHLGLPPASPNRRPAPTSKKAR